MVVAFKGPWAIERINIPEPNRCTEGFRVDENFCGIPISGVYLFLMLFGNVFGSVFELLVGDGNFKEFAFTFLAVWFFLSPTISMILLVASKGEPFVGWEGVHIGLLSLAIILGTLGVILSRVTLMIGLWGIWLYMLLLVSELVFELVKLRLERKSQQSRSLVC